MPNSNDNQVDRCTLSYKAGNRDIAFTEETFSGLLLGSTAGWLAGPAFSQGVNNASPVSADKQAVIGKYTPMDAIASGVQEYFAQTLRWTPVAQASDYTVTIYNPGWGIKAHALKVTTYSIFYNSSVVITENRPSAGGAQRSDNFSCSYQTDSKYSYDEIFANDASVVRLVMGEAAAKCIENYRASIGARILKDSQKS